MSLVRLWSCSVLGCQGIIWTLFIKLIKCNNNYKLMLASVSTNLRLLSKQRVTNSGLWLKTEVLGESWQAKFSCDTVHEKCVFASSACVVERIWINKILSAVCVFSRPVRGDYTYAGNQLMWEGCARGTKVRVQLRQRIVGFGKLIYPVFLNRSTKWIYWADKPAINLCSWSQFSNICNAYVVFYTGV